jgi:hypothetical protein
MFNLLENHIQKALINYDKKNEKYKEIIKSKNYTFNEEDNVLYFIDIDNRKFKYNILGYFDYNTKIWIWSWTVPSFKYKDIFETQKLLDYGIKIDYQQIKYQQSLLFIKSQLTTSRFILDTKHQLDIHLAITLQILNEKFDFIYKVKKELREGGDNFLYLYYILKEI